ncbi:hypothetical protein DPMN_042513 [Dreissena polymorpha]|uniref:Uncharacterized protein n=1 Tax=Dreissena polymorpha TaxID=45954 RepID=A0A9D4HX13_DREPO|nr:hypothetical protein DPMN_042513 [Dreissena polymorpha]
MGQPNCLCEQKSLELSDPVKTTESSMRWSKLMGSLCQGLKIVLMQLQALLTLAVST